MELTALSCANYKAFRDRVDLELRPLTILLGKNNAGKSTLARLPIQLLHALSPRAEVGRHLELRLGPSDGPLEYGGVLRDLIHRRLPHGHVEVGLKLLHDHRTLDLAATIQNVSPRLEDEYSVVSAWRARGALEASFEWEQTPARPPVYRGDIQPLFQGLWPTFSGGEPPAPEFLRWHALLEPPAQRVSYLAPIRRPIPRVCAMARPSGLGWHGEGTPFMLASDDALLRAVAHWYAEHLEGWAVSLDSEASAFALRLRRGRTTVSFADAGHGMAQVLPVVTQQCALAAADTRAQGLYIVEQPELHLHPAAHGALADLFVANADKPGVRMIVETHSENFLLRVRRRVADGSLDRDRVALYWIDELPEGASCVRPLEIEARGEIPDWPEGVFSEGYRDVVAIRRAARAAAPKQGT